MVRGRPEDPAWVRPALLALLVGTGFLYIWGLGASGWANSFYSAAVQAGTKSWKAFFFGSSDASNFITVDKPPASLWVMEISARLFGVNSWSILVPQALEGVATVGLLFVTVRRWFTPGAALLAGAVVALTPVATLMFRFNNPDALLTLLLTGAAYATIRAVEAGRSRWMVLAGTLIGFGFITKMLQAIILMPVLALVYLLAGPPKLGRRMRPGRLRRRGHGGRRRLVGGGRPAHAGRRPPLHRGLDRQQPSQPHLRLQRVRPAHRQRDGQRRRRARGRRAACGARSGGTGCSSREMGGQISWLIPGALIGLVAALWMTRRAPRTDRVRAGVPGLRRLAAPHRGHPQLRPRDHPPVLHGRPGPGRRRPGGHGGVHPVARAGRRSSRAWPWPLAIVATIAWAFVILGLEPRLVPGTAMGDPGRRAWWPPSASP